MFWNRVIQAVDAATVIVSFLVAWFVRFQTGWVMYGNHNSLSYYLPVMLLAIPLFLCTNWISGMYRPMRSRSIWHESIIIARSLIIGLLAFMSLLYFLHMTQFSRVLLAIFAVVFTALTYSAHAVMRSILSFIRSRGMNKKFVLIVGWTEACGEFVENLNHQPWFGYHVLGVVADGAEEQFSSRGLLRIGQLDDLQQVITTHLVDYAIISIPNQTSGLLYNILAMCEEHGVQSLIVPDYVNILQARPRFETFAGMPLIDTRHVPLDDAVNATLKRTFDIVFSLIALLGLSPLFIVIALLIKFTSRGPVVFKQQRTGKNRRVFTMYKFRTMKADTEDADGCGWTIPNDPRRTPVGRLLRRTSLDELPQFWNVLIGDMSVIGPRPERPQLVDRFRHEVPKYMIKHRIRPGITGWAQVNGLRGDTSITERISLDIDYIERWSLMLDIKIAMKTFVACFVHPNAY